MASTPPASAADFAVAGVPPPAATLAPALAAALAPELAAALAGAADDAAAAGAATDAAADAAADGAAADVVAPDEPQAPTTNVSAVSATKLPVLYARTRVPPRLTDARLLTR